MHLDFGTTVPAYKGQGHERCAPRDHRRLDQRRGHHPGRFDQSTTVALLHGDPLHANKHQVLVVAGRGFMAEFADLGIVDAGGPQRDGSPAQHVERVAVWPTSSTTISG